MRELQITKAEENQRLDKYLKKYLNLAPASFVYKMLRKKNIKLNRQKAEGSELLKNGDQIRALSGGGDNRELQGSKESAKSAAARCHLRG